MKYDDTVFNEVISKKRWFALTKFLKDNECKFFQYAIKEGITTAEEFRESMDKGQEAHRKYKRYVLAEVFSRTIGIKIICRKYGYSSRDIKHMPLSCHYDVVAPDGHKFEFKFRVNDNDQYDTDRIDEEKKDWNTTSTADDVILVYSYWDGKARAYDMFSPDNITVWNKPNGSVAKFSLGEYVETVSKPAVEYSHSNCLWSGSTIMPDFTNTI